MIKTYGSQGRDDRLIIYGTQRAVLIYGYGADCDSGYDYRHTFDHVPTRQEVIDVLVDHIDELTRERILSGCEYEGCRVWLSAENQANYMAAFILASTTPDALPYVVKMESLSDGSDVYREFSTLSGLGDFVRHFRQHIDRAQSAGWQEKSSVREVPWLPL